MYTCLTPRTRSTPAVTRRAGTNNTISNVVRQQIIPDTGRHETNNSGQRKDDGRGFHPAAKGSREAMAGRSDDEFRDCAGARQDCSSGNSSGKKVGVRGWYRKEAQRMSPQEISLGCDHGRWLVWIGWTEALVNSNKGPSTNAARTLFAVSGEPLGSPLIWWKASVTCSRTSIRKNGNPDGAPSKSYR